MFVPHNGHGPGVAGTALLPCNFVLLFSAGLGYVPILVETRLLFVDSDGSTASMLAEALGDRGHVTHATNAATARRWVAQSPNRWTGLISEVALPDGDGLDVLAFARTVGCTAPSLVLTTAHDPATINRAYELGARYLIKPAADSQILSFALGLSRHAHGTSSRTQRWTRRYSLTNTEAAILVAVAGGASRDDVLAQRHIAVGTFKKHVQNLLRKTSDHSLLAAAARFLRDDP